MTNARINKKVALSVVTTLCLASPPSEGREVFNIQELNDAITNKESFLNIDSDIVVREPIDTISSNIEISGNDYSFFGQGLYGGLNILGGVNAFLEHLNFSDFNSSSISALYNQGITEISQFQFTDNVSTQAGGAIKNQSGSLKVFNSDIFNSALTGITQQNSGGGAIYNNALFEIHNSQIIGNTIKNEATNSGGGAVFNSASGYAKFYAVMFQNNTITSDSDYKKGGALYNQGNAYIFNAGFFDNILTGDGENIAGGGIYNQSGVVSMENVYFYNNKANYGSAIYNEASGIINIYNSTFVANSATTAGGAIYNAGITNIIADDGIMRFYSNSVTAGADEAIYNIGELNMNAGSNSGREGVHSSTGFIDYRDDINGDGTGIVNIHKSYNTIDHDSNSSTANVSSPTSGIIFLNGAIKNNDLHLYNGYLSFAHGTIAEHFSGGDFEKSGGSLWLDVDLANAGIDTINADAVTGSPDLSFFRVLSNIDTDVTLDVFTGANPTSIITSNTYTNNTIYEITSDADGYLTFSPTYSANGYAAANAATGDKSFTLTDDMVLTGRYSNAGNLTFYGNIRDAQNLTVNADGTVTISDSNIKYGDHLYEVTGNNTYVFSGGNNKVLNIVDAVIRDCAAGANYGGVAGHNNGTINVINSVLINNSTNAGYNGGAISSPGTVNIFYSSFIGNTAGNFGGALSNGNKAMTAYMSLFDGNKASKGGAISTRGYFALSDSMVKNNHATDDGGSLYLYIQGAEAGEAVIDTTTFESNSAVDNGGAIYNDGEVTLLNSQFSKNTASEGGAIYNTGVGVVNIASVASEVKFSENKDAVGYNAIYNSSIVNINASLLNKIIFDDTIKGLNGTININNTSSLGDVVEGDVVFNNIISGNTINFYNGTLQFGSVSMGGNDYYGALAAGVDLNANGGQISFIDDKIHSVHLGDLTLNSDIELAVDVDLNIKEADKITIDSFNANGNTIWLKEINVIADESEPGVEVKLSDNTAIQQAIELDVNYLITQTDSVINSYSVLYTNSTGILEFSKMNFKDTVNSTADTKIYTFTETEYVNLTLGQLGGSVMGVAAKGFDIIASPGVEGITMSGAQEITFTDVKNVNGFTNYFITAQANDTINFNTSTGQTTTLSNAILGDADININAQPSYAGDVVFQEATSANSINIKQGNATFNADVNASIENEGNVTINNSDVSGTVTSTGSLTTTGDVLFDDVTTLSSLINTGTLELNANTTISGNVTNTGATINANKDFALSSTFSGGEFNLLAGNMLTLSGTNADFANTNVNINGDISTQDNGIFDYNLSNATINNTGLNLDMQLDFATGIITSDTFSGNITGSAIIDSITISGFNAIEDVSGSRGFIEIFTSGSIGIDEGSSSTSYVILGQNYTINFQGTTNGLDYQIGSASNNLVDAITSILDPRTYIMFDNTTESAGTNSSLSGNLTIQGNGSTISDGNIIIENDASLTISNANINADLELKENAKFIVSGSDITSDITSSSNNSVVEFSGSQAIDFSGIMSGVDVNLETTLNRAGQDTNVDYTIKSGSTLSYANDNHLGGGTNSLTFDGGSLNMANNDTNNIALKSLTLNADAKFSLDVDLENKEMDTISFDNVSSDFISNGYKIIISGLNIISNGIDDVTKVIFTTENELAQAVENQVSQSSTIYSPIFAYDVTYANDNNIGEFTFSKQGGNGGFNPAVQTEDVSNKTIYNATIDFSKQLLQALDIYSPLGGGRATGDALSKLGGAWVKSFASKEDIKLGGLTVDSEMYAGILGVDGVQKIGKTGIRSLYSLYASYLNSTQEYNDVAITQDGINFGIRGLYDKGNWFAGAVANIGINLIEGNNMYGSEDFETYTTSLSLKTGYDINLYCKEYVLQTSLTVSYLYAYTTDYYNSANIEIKSDALHVLNLNPELRFVAHHDNGYSSYASASYNWNIEAGGDTKADNVAIPNLSVDPYAEYKIGVTKKVDDDISAYAEVFATSGGREGYGGQVGVKWNF